MSNTEREAFEKAFGHCGLTTDEYGNYHNWTAVCFWRGWERRAALSAPTPQKERAASAERDAFEAWCDDEGRKLGRPLTAFDVWLALSQPEPASPERVALVEKCKRLNRDAMTLHFTTVTGAIALMESNGHTTEKKVRELHAAIDRLASLPASPADPPPIDMVLHCPVCGVQHIDGPMTDEQYTERLHESSWWELGGDKPVRWDNPPHRSHLCAGCGHIWRPADVPTNGVVAITTKGKNDSPRPEPASRTKV